MKLLTLIISVVLIAGLAYAGPPEPPEPPEPMEAMEVLLGLESLAVLDEPLTTIKGLERILLDIEEGLEITEISIGGDSIIIRLSNDSIFILSDFDDQSAHRAGEDIVQVGRRIIIEENEVVRGDVVSAFGDIIVKGTVNGGVLAFSGDIYVTSTGNIKEGAVAISGKVKQDPGARIGTVIWKTDIPRSVSRMADRTPFRVMGFVFLVVLLVWMVLSATCASIFQANVARVVDHIKSDFVTSFLKGYLVYLLAFTAFIILLITILGIPLALLGMPITLIAGMILGSTALSNMVGEKMLHADRLSFKTFLYGSAALGAVPALFFFVQMITGSMVLMIFSWILIGLFLFVIIPFGLGAVLSTRFGTRPGKAASESVPADQTDSSVSG
jgi:ABC-type multidrug transport system fused ATPase/permease subunit